jgi:hypothetical protein
MKVGNAMAVREDYPPASASDSAPLVDFPLTFSRRRTR